MEALVAVGLASNILSFVDFAKSIVSDAKRFYETTSDAKDEYQEAEDYAQRLQRLAAHIAMPKGPHGGDISGEEKELKELGEQCLQIANQLLATTRDVTANSHNDWVQSARRAVKASLSSSQIKSLQTRLNRIHQQLMGKLLQNQLEKTKKTLDDMADENHRLSSRRDRDILQLQGQLEDVKHLLKNGQSQKDILLWLSGIAENGAQFSAEQLIFGRLFFHDMNQRHTNVHVEHEKTLSWIFEEDSPVHFTEFLESQSNVYWVSGKPGSGKSTAMKYICQHSETWRRLEQWANGNRLIVAKFFFWNAGRSHLLKSLEGLLQSILYQIFRAAPALIPHAFPEDWDAYLSGNVIASSSSAGSFSIAQLLAAIRMLCGHLSELDVKICIFVDGLDEYDGRPSDVIRLIEALSISTNLKACVSSRPWNEFEKAFGQDQRYKLYMQDLTRSDIRKYVRDHLEKDATFSELVEAEGQDKCMTLVHDIVDAAQGVFLWVTLVVRSLLDGLTNADTFSNLQRRLQSLPTDLDEFFDCILFSVDEFYSSEAARMCLITLIAAKPLSLMSYWFIDEENGRYALDLEVKPMEPPLISSRLETMKKRLNAYCKGLLETIDTGREHDGNPDLWHDFYHQRVDFLHRTVRDFFRIPQTQQRILDRIPKGFNPEIAICQALLAQVKSSSHEEEFLSLEKLLEVLFQYSSALEHESIPVQREVEIMDQLDTTLKIQSRLLRLSLFDYGTGSRLSGGFLSACVRSGLLRYIYKVLEREPKPSSDELACLLATINQGVKPSCWEASKEHDDWSQAQFDGLWSESQAQLTRRLFAVGADPNYKLRRFKSTPWTDFLDTIIKAAKVATLPAMALSILEDYTTHGATLKSTQKLDGEKLDYKNKLRRMMNEDQFELLLKLADPKKKKGSRLLSGFRQIPRLFKGLERFGRHG